jgi:hypothetical protein
MKTTEKYLRDALTEIRERAVSALDGNAGTARHERGRKQDETELPAPEDLGCVIKSLPERLLIPAADSAIKINPVNAPPIAAVRAIADEADVDVPLRMAVSTAKYWGPTPRRLTVSFMETTPADLQARILNHMNAWTKTGCISFVATTGVGQVRISRGAGGYYSYLGTDILHIPPNRQTMNLEAFTMNTPESEYKRVVRHETGHTLGAPHEHMRRALVAKIDPQLAYAYFWRTQGWTRAMVDAQVLTPLDERTIMSTPPDQDSIMCYQLPGSITRDGLPIRGGLDINASDYAFVGQIYPQSRRDHDGASVHRAKSSPHAEDWPESDDIEPEI